LKLDNYERFKTKEFYSKILFDDGKAPSDFEKDHLVVEREKIDEVLNKDIRLMSKNLRIMTAGPLSILRKQDMGLERQGTSPSPKKQYLHEVVEESPKILIDH